MTTPNPAPFESLLLLMCLKCLYPNKIYLLKGHLEEPASIKVRMICRNINWLETQSVTDDDLQSLGLDDWLFRRKVPRESVLRVSETIMVGLRCSYQLSLWVGAVGASNKKA